MTDWCSLYGSEQGRNLHLTWWTFWARPNLWTVTLLLSCKPLGQHLASPGDFSEYLYFGGNAWGGDTREKLDGKDSDKRGMYPE